ncbi:MAG: 4Fe-4S binding protein [Bryobacteraceae bacterium]
MAYFITDNCTACGDCLTVCPTDAIRPSQDRPRIVRDLCTECVGFSSAPQCVPVCEPAAIVFDESPWPLARART